MTVTTIANLPLTTTFSADFTTSVRSVPVGFQSLTIVMSPTTGNAATPFQGVAHPFNSTSMSITFGIKYLWDGGVTFPDSLERTEVGSPTGQWSGAHGSTSMTPTVNLGLVWDSAAADIPAGDPNQGLDPKGFATSYVAYVHVVGGPFNSGILVQETTA